MNYIFAAMIIISLGVGAINGKLSETLAGAFSGAESAVNTIIAMAGIFSFWCGVLKLSEKSGFSKVIAKIISPVLGLIFPGISKNSKAFSAISMNVTANLLGMGNAATPAGIDAMCELDRINGYSFYASNEMCMFVVLNTASLQLIPTTIMSLRASCGSGDAGAVIVPIWIVSAVSLLAGLLMMKFIISRGKKI